MPLSANPTLWLSSSWVHRASLDVGTPSREQIGHADDLTLEYSSIGFENLRDSIIFVSE